MSDFGECTNCFNQVERTFWDSLCFDCQDELKREEEDEDEEMDAPDEDFYIAPHEGRG